MNIFFASDHHFHHKNILTFKDHNNNLLRVFDDVEEMNEYMVECHNRVVKPSDKVYFLGDISMSRNSKDLEILGRLQGEKILIKGNHDLCTANQYLKYFKDIRGSHQFGGMILTHVPIHPESLARWGLNVHGHLHSNRVVLRDQAGNVLGPDHRYFNVSMEQIDYTPISLEEIKNYKNNK